MRTHEPVFNARYRKVGGIHFLRLGRLQFSFCICKPTMELYPHEWAEWVNRPYNPRDGHMLAAIERELIEVKHD